jgi:hypothetical protein
MPISFPLLFIFDGVGAVFFSLLSLALLFCFYFLNVYFEYDSGGVGIILLSAVFAQVAL